MKKVLMLKAVLIKVINQIMCMVVSQINTKVKETHLVNITVTKINLVMETISMGSNVRKKSAKDLIQLTIIIKEIKIVGDTQKINLKHLIVNKTRMLKVNNENVKIVPNLMFHLMIGAILILLTSSKNYQKKIKVIMKVKNFIDQIIKNKMI